MPYSKRTLYLFIARAKHVLMKLFTEKLSLGGASLDYVHQYQMCTSYWSLLSYGEGYTRAGFKRKIKSNLNIY